MSKQEPGTGSSGFDPDVQDEAGEAGLMREILRTQERTGKGGSSLSLTPRTKIPSLAGTLSRAGRFSTR
jgi:hypothetical protein